MCIYRFCSLQWWKQYSGPLVKVLKYYQQNIFKVYLKFRYSGFQPRGRVTLKGILGIMRRLMGWERKKGFPHKFVFFFLDSNL